MSTIPTKQIDGDVAVGRNVSMGGTGTVRGSLTVGHNLTVEGWLEAKNIKGPSKGLFKSVTQLREAYPNPKDGWWALVAVSGSADSDHLGQLYMADGGTWVAQVDSSGNPLMKGNPTIDSTEYMEAVEELTKDVEEVKVELSEVKDDHKRDFTSLQTTQTTQGNAINANTASIKTAQASADAAKADAAKAQAAADKAQSALDDFKGTKGAAGGIAPLGADGLVSSQYLPEYVDDVLEIGGTRSGITVLAQTAEKKSTDDKCSVVYNEDKGAFVLAVASAVAVIGGGSFFTYYSGWTDADTFGTQAENGVVPHRGKLYVDAAGKKAYCWSGAALVAVGTDLALGHESGNAYPGDEGASLAAWKETADGDIADLKTFAETQKTLQAADCVVNANTLLGYGDTPREFVFSDVLSKLWENDADIKKPGVVVTFMASGGWKSKQWTNAGSKGESDWKNEGNWSDFGGGGSAIGNTVNVNALCGEGTYTLSEAIKAVQAKEEETGQTYLKGGVVLTYKTSETTSSGLPKWEARQFILTADDLDADDEKPWVEFGGSGGGNVATSDTPAEGGKDAFSTGGAYTNIPADLHLEKTDNNTYKLWMTNAGEQQVGNEVQFQAGGEGGGGGTGTVMSVQCEQSPLYAKAGGSVIIKASVRSVTTVGSDESSNVIEKVVLKDRDTGQTLETFAFNKASSASSDTYDFEMDVSSYFVTASTRRFQLVAYDDAGNTGSRNLNVSGVDVTITSVQTLNYTASTALAVGGSAKSISMYKFANNASDKGIKAVTEIYLGGEWQTLGTDTVQNTYSHNITIDPNNCLGQKLTHGAYPLRIHGEDIGSGVTGNYLHTVVFVVDNANTTPLVAMRWYTEGQQGTRKNYENIEVDYAVYVSNDDEPQAKVYYDGATATSTVAYRSKTYTFKKQVSESVHDGTKKIEVYASCGGASSETAVFVVDGSLVDIEEFDTSREFDISFDTRSNSETDKTIKDGGVEMTVTGCNWSSNGFVKDSYNTESYGTDSDKGRMALRIAEDMKAVCTYKPFKGTDIQQNGMALSFTVKVKNVADRTAKLIDCLGDNTLGFYLTGEKLVFTCDGGAAADPENLGAQKTAVALYATDKETRFDIVIEPTSAAPYSGIGSVKIFVNGDEAAATYYEAGGFANNDMQMQFDGTNADIYLYRCTAWATWYNYRQAFDNYLVGQKDADAMLAEYDKNQVMASQTAEGVTKDRPTLSACMNAGLCCVTLLKNHDTSAELDSSYPGCLDGLYGYKKTKAYFDWVLRFPDRPWQDCKVYNVPTTNQGTTSSQRPIKNKKGKFKNCTIEMLHTEDDFKDDAAALAKFQTAQKMAKKSKVQVIDGGLWVKTITIKVDYSDSTGANNGATMELFNRTQRALGADYMTPAQNAYNGEGTMNTSIDSVPCALFRTDINSVDAESETYAYFHAKANFNVDKGNPDFFGFEKVDGYNGGCLNYGDFVELVAERGQTLDAFKTQTLADTSSLVASNIYMLSEWCGEKHYFLENDGSGSMTETAATADPETLDKTLAEVQAEDVAGYDWGTVYLTSDGKYVKYSGGKWKDTTGEMSYDANTKKWGVTGRVLNPVECYEYLKYNSLCWLQGVNSVDDLMKVDESTGEPVWLGFYESRYPDDDDLNALYANGKKVPYKLYKWLEWTQQCSQDLTEADGNIQLHGAEVSGTKENRLKKWSEELYLHASVQSTGAYIIGSDYVLAVDQRSKNMMIAFYLDTNGLNRAYFNHWYDGDCCWLADNDCGITIPWNLDSANDPDHKYQGWNSVMFKQGYAAANYWLSDNGGDKITLHDIAGKMRNAYSDGIKIFSADGCKKLWITDRIEKWAKVTSSFDGERKYIENSQNGSNYYYAVHGLRYEDLPVTFAKRFAYRDGYFQVGDLYDSPFKMRAKGTDISVKITAAQDGFFGLGVDRADTCTDSCYLKAGESYTLKSGVTDIGSGTMLYVFGAKNLASLDLSGCTTKAEGFDISTCELLQELTLGGEDYTPLSEAISNLDLGNKSFLRRIDVRNTAITGIDARKCPRLREVLASGSPLSTITLAETAPIETLELPATMTALKFKNLPKLSYPGGLTIAGMKSVQSVLLDNCPNIDTMELLRAITDAGSLKRARITGINATASVSMLRAIKKSGAVGMDADGNQYDESGQCSGLVGRWILTELAEDSEVEELDKYFPKLAVYNSQYSYITFDDAEENSANITNPENGSFGDSYQVSGHFKRYDEECHTYKCSYDTTDADNPKMVCEQVSDSDYAYMADGTEWDPTDSTGAGYDVMKRMKPYWYKGVNDFKNQQKHFFLSCSEDEPLSTAEKCVRTKLADCLRSKEHGLDTTKLVTGGAYALAELSGHNVYAVDVEGMKQVRWPGMNDATYGAVFTDEEDKVVGTFNMAVSDKNQQFDFNESNGDYVFCPVPNGAKTFLFTSAKGLDDLECITVDSEAIEAIEPEWVHTRERLIGVYQISKDKYGRVRSLSGATVQRGDGTATTNTDWKYDENGRVANTTVPSSAMHYTYKDFMNLCEMRGKGYQAIDYEVMKDLANIVMALVGTRDIQKVCGQGAQYTYGTTGTLNKYGNHMSTDLANAYLPGNVIFGIQMMVSCAGEFMDNVAENVSTFKSWKKRKCVADNYEDPLDAKWHIYDPVTGTERVVQGLSSGGCVSRVKFGRYADIIATKYNSETSGHHLNYTDTQTYSATRGRGIYRGSTNGSTGGGLVNSDVCQPNTSNMSSTSRLMYTGKIEIK